MRQNIQILMMAFSVLLSTTAWALDLREGDIYGGKILIGKENRGQACYLKVEKDLGHNANRSFSLLTYEKSQKTSGQIDNIRRFRARQYDGYLTAIGSSPISKNSDGIMTIKKNTNESLHVSFQNGQTIDNALILNAQNVVVNCVGLRLLR